MRLAQHRGQRCSTRSMSVGYGWFQSENKWFGDTAYYMNGRAPVSHRSFFI
jgi:hypothetical protein